MTPFEKQFHKEAKKIRMRASLKRELREQIMSYMEYHPLPDTPKERSLSAHPSVAKGFASAHAIIVSWRFRSLAGALAVIFFVSVPYAAEYAVPGDVLYPVKVRINEEVLSQLSLSPYEKIEWEARRVERRIAEARLLAKEGRLTEEAEAEISQTVRAHAAKATKGLAALHESDAEDAAVAQVALESALDVQTTVLETDTLSFNALGNAQAGNSQIRYLMDVVRDAKAGVVASGASFPTTTLSYDRFMTRIKQETVRARVLFGSIGESVSRTERLEVERRLEDIDRQIVSAQDAHTLGATENAVDLLRGALSDTQKLIAFMTDIDVRSSVDLESLVPKKLTNEERIARIGVFVLDLASVRADALSRVGSSTDAVLEERVRVAVNELDTLLGAVASSTESGDIVEAEATLLVAKSIAADLSLAVAELPPLKDTSETPEATELPESQDDAEKDGTILGI